MRIHFLAPWPWPLTFLSDGLDQIENGKWLLRIKLTTWTVSVISSEERGSQKYGHRNVLVITDDKVGRTEDSRCQRLPPHWRRCCSSVPTVTPRRCQTRQSWQLRRLGRRLVFARRYSQPPRHHRCRQIAQRCEWIINGKMHDRKTNDLKRKDSPREGKKSTIIHQTVNPSTAEEGTSTRMSCNWRRRRKLHCRTASSVSALLYICLFRTKMQIQYKREVKYIHTYHQCPVYHENSVFSINSQYL